MGKRDGTEAAIHTTAQNERKKHESERTLFRATWQLPRCFFTAMMKAETGWRDLFNLFLSAGFSRVGNRDLMWLMRREKCSMSQF